jgi:hypothetical protein
MYRVSVRLLLAFSLFLGICQIVDAEPPAPLRLKFVSESGTPIAEVNAEPGSFVYKNNTGASFATGDLKTVDGGELISNAEGEIIVAVPELELGNLFRFRLRANHPAFAGYNQWVTVAEDGPTVITLTRGVRIAVTAVDAETGEQLQKNLYAIAEQKNLDQMEDWTPSGAGMLLSRVLPNDDKRVRLVQIEDGVAVRFSNPLDIVLGDGEKRFVNAVPMEPAIRVQGRLAGNVPRPIINGQISVCVAWPTDDELADYGPAGHWLAHAEITAEGDFTLDGIPSGDWLQVIASCDGWYSEPAPADVRKLAYPGENNVIGIEASILPHLFDSVSFAKELLIPMLPTQSATIRLVDSSNQPVAGATLVANRSQRFFGASWLSREFRLPLSTTDELLAMRSRAKYQPERRGLATRVEAVSDVDGIVELNNVPGENFLVTVKGYRFVDKFTWKGVRASEKSVIEIERE